MIRNRGFTLVELVIVIVLLAIVAIFSFQFVGFGSRMYASGAERVRILDQSRFVIERLTREVRNSVPNSARVAAGGQCLEFVPIRAAGTYYNAPLRNSDPEQLTFVSLSEVWETITDTDRLFIFATLSSHIYDADAGRSATLAASTDNDDSTYEQVLDLASGSVFSQSSPRQRLFIGQPPVSYCVESNQIVRYSNYGWQVSQPIPGSFPSAERSVMAEQVANIALAEPAFQVDQATLLQNNIVHLFIQFTSIDDERLFFSQEVHIPNAP